MKIFSPKSWLMPSLVAASIISITSCSQTPQVLGGVGSEFLLESNDKNTAVNVFVNNNGRLQYDVSFNDNAILQASNLGVTINGVDLGQSVKIKKPSVTQVDESYTLISKPQKIQNAYTQWTFPIEHLDSGTQYKLVFRIYDDGVAYRYEVDSDSRNTINGEASSWVMANNLKTWFFERNSAWKLMSYAGVWENAKTDEMPTISSQGPIQGTPLVFELEDGAGYATITKAALYNYSGMRLEAKGNNTFQANFTEGKKGFYVDGDVVTPWRVTLLADDLNELVNSNVITNLNPAPDENLFKDTAYIKPGRSVWSWMTSHTIEKNDQKSYVDKAKQLAFEYSIIDDGWKFWDKPWETVTEVTQYGKQNGVGVWVWVDSKDLNFPAGDYIVMREYFDKVQATGAVGLKIDFMNNETKSSVDFEIAALTIAAQRGLLINFHGCHASTGEARTFPNELTREGIRGIEVNHHKSGHLDGAHNTALPFTRLALGSGDYTPLYYSNPGDTTWAHQLATAIMFKSAMQIYAENPKVLMNHPIAKKGLNILQQIPTVWDEVKVLSGSKIGEFAAIAKRSGDKWFLSVLNSKKARSYSVDLSFLNTGEYALEYARDDMLSPLIDLKPMKEAKYLRKHTKARGFEVGNKTINKQANLTISLASDGGYAAVFSPTTASL